MIEMTEAQREALVSIYNRKTDHPDRINIDIWKEGRPTLEQYMESAFNYGDGTGCIMIKWYGMYLGIETDGYIHS